VGAYTRTETLELTTSAGPLVNVEGREVIGRETEIAAVEAFLDSLHAGPAALLVSGEPGIGKSTLWRAGVASARSRSLRVLLCRPVEAEAGLPYVALADLLESIPQETLASLPAPQREALEVALRRAGATDPLDRVTVARGALAAISSLGGSTVVAIDDAQWLDAPSRDALRFAFRRLDGGERIGLFATVRSDDERTPLDVDAALPPDRITRLVLGPLELGELENIVRTHSDVWLPRTSWRAVHRVSGGNPLFALQIADAVARKGGLAPGEEPPLPETLPAAVRERLASLSARARLTLLVAAALGKPTAALLDAAAADEAGLQEALAARILGPEGDRLRFAHPLLAAVVYGEAPAAERRKAHRLLADLVDDPEEQALHLGRGSDVPDEPIAATLEAAADRAAQLGAPETAAELALHAERLTPATTNADSARRATQAARYTGRSGDTERSIEILRRLVTTLPAGRARAGAFALLGFIDWDPATLLRAAEEAEGDLELLAVAHTDASMIELRRGGREDAVAHARAAVSAARKSGNAAVLAKALTAQALPEAHGRAERAFALLDEAADLERSLTEPLSLINSPSTWRGAILLDADRFAEAREALEEAFQRGLALGLASRALPLTYLVELECREGTYERALTHSLEAEALWTGGEGVALTLVGRVLVEAHLGNVEVARATGRRSIELARGRLVDTLARTEAALGLLELSLGNFAPALDRLHNLVTLPAGEPLRDAIAFRAAANAVEALLGLGRTAEAKELAQRVEQRARRVDLPSWVAAAFRCRALVLAESGDVSGAHAAIGEAKTVHANHFEPFERARTLLAAGAIERRAKRKAEAREDLERARAIFEELGTRLWYERARLELQRTGVYRVGGDLSAAERQVAELAASGATNREIAAALFMSVKTVEAHLSRVYRKLNVRSRTELASHISPAVLTSRRDDTK
jgi:DNA-binding CsgD family transcriptional regulator